MEVIVDGKEEEEVPNTEESVKEPTGQEGSLGLKCSMHT